MTGKLLAWLFPDKLIHPLVKYSTCLAMYPIILLFSYILYRLLEKPSISLGKFVWSRFNRKPNDLIPKNL